MVYNKFSRFCIFILILFLLSFNFTKGESQIKTLPGKRFTTQEEISEFLKTTDLTILVFYYKTGSEKSNAVAENLKIVYSKLQYLIEYVIVNCDDNSMEECIANDDNIDEDDFFRIEIYVPPEYKFNPYTKEMNKHQKLLYTKTSITDKTLYNFLTKAIISREQLVTSENYENFKSRTDLNKVILFTNRKSAPLMYRGLSGYFYDRLALGLVYNTEKSFAKN